MTRVVTIDQNIWLSNHVFPYPWFHENIMFLFFDRHLSPEFSQMNDKDRDMIDKETQHFIKICSEHITGLQSTC